MRVGVSPDSWGIWFPNSPLQMPWERCLDEMAEAGYSAIEIGPLGYLPTEPEKLRRALDSRGLRVAAGFLFGDFAIPDGWRRWQDQAEQLIDLIGPLGGTCVVLIPALYRDPLTSATIGARELSEAQWNALFDTCTSIAQLTEDRGLVTAFHPHAETAIETEAQIERFMAGTANTPLGLCLDVGHHAYRGGDPIAFFGKHAARIKHLHLKNVDPMVVSSVRRFDIPFADAVKAGVMCTLDAGAVDFADFLEVVDGLGYDGWGIVEQDMFPAEFDKPAPIAKRNLDFLARTLPAESF